MIKSLLSKLKLRPAQVVMAIMLVVLIYTAFATLRVIARNYQLQQRMDELVAQNEVLELENQQLRYEITYYQTDSFVEKEARAKLELQAPGEHVVIFPDKIPGPYSPPEPDPEAPFADTLTDNFREWVYFLFRVEI